MPPHAAYSLVIDAPGGEIAAAVPPTRPTVASAYTASAGARDLRLYLATVTREPGGAADWTTPIVIESAQPARVRPVAALRRRHARAERIRRAHRSVRSGEALSAPETLHGPYVLGVELTQPL